MVKRLLIISFLVAVVVLDTFGQGAFASLRLNRTKVYPNQPIKASITVYTSTWFTEPLRFENLVIPDAFVIPFKRTQSGIHYINGKKYAGLEFFFLIYPYDEGTYTISPFSITAVTPPEGDYKGRAVTLQTKPTTFEVQTIPSEFEGDQWFVANSVRVTDRWEKSLEQLQVGDVINRLIRIEASGTLPALIPELPYEEVDFARIYPKSPETEDTRSSKQANGVRIEKRTYLFEQEGTFILPEEVVYYWNPYRSRSEKRSIPEIQIIVRPNENLGMVASVRDSLESTLNTATVEEESAKGIPWERIVQVVIWVMVLAVNIWLLFSIYRAGATRWNAYRKSPAFLKRQAQKATSQNAHQFLKYFYRWWDSAHDNPSVRETFASTHLAKVEKSYLNNSSSSGAARDLLSEADHFEHASQNSNVPEGKRPLKIN